MHAFEVLGVVGKLLTEAFQNSVLQIEPELVNILHVDQSVLDDSLALVGPETVDLASRAPVISYLGLHEAFADLAQVSQVELIEELP